LTGYFHLPCPSFNETGPTQLAQHIAAAMADEIAFQGAQIIAAFIMEPIRQAGGVIVPDATSMPLLRKICDQHSILMISG